MRLTKNLYSNQVWILVFFVIVTFGCSQKPVSDSGDSEVNPTTSTASRTKGKDAASAPGKEEPTTKEVAAATKADNKGLAPSGRDTPRKIAEWIISVNGRVMLKESDQWIEKIDDLPPNDQVTIAKVWLWEKQDGATPIQPDDMLAIAKLTELEELVLRGQPIGDSMIHVLTDLKNLQVLNLHACGITDESFPSFAKMKQLRVLDVGYSHRKITDEGVANLAELRDLERLCLFASAITDKSLKILETLPRLKSVEIKATDVTEQGIENFKARLPNCHVGT